MARHKTDMQRRHFELIAATIKALPIDQAQKQIVAREFVAALQTTNANFNAVTFYLACDCSWQAS